MRHKTLVSSLTFVLLVIIGSLLFLRILNWNVYKDFGKISAGMSEAEVVRILGKSLDIIKAGDGKAFPIPGYASDTYPISEKVLVYYGDFDSIAYVYINRSGRVEHVFAGGS